ncbi:hypothetical protein [Cupriavidus oxalaticus]|uniref:Uncharacterized protein n=2 Tax=Cupriavidus oxalaticus TaxID=96344 RepID=A0ABX7HU14_9BURK|nr:hypothetical protein [Cupriavidus oxalaticus]QRQ88186.1 hypothetical protein JTE91_16475 [Cupriavidus oxalaticus]QRQ93487.1 hypothetical protein JTE92_25785 [Cupriavidus oxalaticus]WQD82112.1 hypothetical protein U0036_13530 [Cupriavidus oxalaticus]
MDSQAERRRISHPAGEGECDRHGHSVLSCPIRDIRMQWEKPRSVALLRQCLIDGVHTLRCIVRCHRSLLFEEIMMVNSQRPSANTPFSLTPGLPEHAASYCSSGVCPCRELDAAKYSEGAELLPPAGKHTLFCRNCGVIQRVCEVFIESVGPIACSRCGHDVRDLSSLVKKIGNLSRISDVEALCQQDGGEAQYQPTLSWEEPIRGAHGAVWPLCAHDENELVYCPHHEDTQPMAVTLASPERGTDGIYCSVCDRAFWAVARSYFADEMPTYQPTGKGPDHFPVMNACSEAPAEQRKADVILARNDWGELTYFMRELEDLCQMQP